MPTPLNLPPLGENIDGGDVVKVLVKAGDVLRADQPILELETGKATLEVPSPVAGTVEAVLVKPGDTISIGQPVLMLADAGVPAAKPAAAPAAVAAAAISATRNKWKQPNRRGEAVPSFAALCSFSCMPGSFQTPRTPPAPPRRHTRPPPSACRGRIPRICRPVCRTGRRHR